MALPNELEKLKKETCDEEKKFKKRWRKKKKEEEEEEKKKENDNNDTLSKSENNEENCDIFPSSSKLLKTFNGHTDIVLSIDCSILDDGQFICSGSIDKALVWNMDTTQKIQSFRGHSGSVNCVKFSPYHYQYHHRNAICSSSEDKTIRIWDREYGREFQIFNGHTGHVSDIEFSKFYCGRYLCSGSGDKTIRLWDVETSKSLHVFNGHIHWILCVDFSPVQSNNNNDYRSNGIGVIGGNGYTICSGSIDNTIRIWDIETTKQLNVFEGHEHWIRSVKYGPNELGVIGGANTILSGSNDKSVRLWDIRSGQQIQMFNGHTSIVCAVEHLPLLVNSSQHAICSGSKDNTIQFWDIRSNKRLYLIKGDEKEDNGITCLKFLSLKDDDTNLCYGTYNGPIRVLDMNTYQ
ncbi:G-protein beta WD-40 repeats containing protein [Reticulomyxa filosa]|uniref:G-protein beta WD-40 repeats containing protein n=1 Tax=Reticulomyxa filosa TaxID=46433 RepID=X6MHA9_RETFI|nr:G-protein beta WD-40 repeats containing protein [Reticulomyxa filosa]|eukprot:ETO12435.1 G-protein beta WD-40 repeats containing protein [Reticulomyxa filosa]